MGRGVSAGGGQSSLGYLFGSGETTKNSPQAAEQKVKEPASVPLQKSASAPASADAPPSQGSTSALEPVNHRKQSSSGTHDTKKNNYFRADGQNCGNFITDRPSSKVLVAPGGGSSLGYLFGEGSK